MRYISKRTVFILSSIAVLGLGFMISRDSSVSAKEYPRFESHPTKTLPSPQISPNSPSSEQKHIIWGKSVKPSYPGVYLFQQDSFKWKVDSYRENNPDLIENIQNGAGGYSFPVVSNIFTKINLEDAAYAPTEVFSLTDGSDKAVSQMSNRKVYFITDKSGYDGNTYKMVTANYDSPPFFEFTVRVGGNPVSSGEHYRPMENFEDGSWMPYAFKDNDINQPKFSIGYKIGFDIEWWGEYTTRKKITLDAPSSMVVDEEKSLTSKVATMEPGFTYYNLDVDITTRTEAQFSVASGTDVLSISGNKVTALKNGTATVQVDFVVPTGTTDKDGNEIKWHLRTTKVIVVGGDGPPPPGSVECTVPVKVNSMNSPASGMVSGAYGELLADNRGSSMFDVSKGISTSESLYANIISKKYLYDYTFEKYEGTCTWKMRVNKTWIHNWEEWEQTGTTSSGIPIKDWVRYGPQSELASKPYEVVRPYSYWTVPKFNTYKISKAVLANYALAGDKTTLNPTSYNLPNILVNQVDPHMTLPEVNTTITLDSEDVPNEGRNGKQPVPDQDWKNIAEDAVGRIKVRNDEVAHDSTKVMDSSWKDDATVDPGALPEPSMTENYVLYSTGLVIPSDKLNSSNNASTGIITYTNWVSLGSPGNIDQNVAGINSVTIHTPVVNYSVMSDSNASFDQSVAQDRSKITLILGRNEDISFSNSGQHVNYLGYGNRDYTKYLGSKRIRFPFDVYMGATFYAKNTWIDVSPATVNFTVRIPEWVTEGSYVVRTESWAENAPGQTDSQHNANTTITNYGAYEEFIVKVVGRVYGFRVYDIGDLRYEDVFRVRRGSSTWSGFQYYSGTNDLNGVALGENVTPSVSLPIRPGSHPTQAATTPHNGYPILFYLNTVGNVWNVGEGVRIEPRFYYVPKKGNRAPVEVDLYYNGTGSKIVKVGSNKDKSLFTRTVMMGDPLRSVSSEFLTYMGTYEYNNFWTESARARRSLTEFLSILSSRKTDIGKGYKEEILNYQMRTLVGKVDTSISVDSNEQRRSVQRWFGEYNLPIDPYVVLKGTNLEEKVRTTYGGSVDGSESVFLKEGYIIVNFDVQTFLGDAPTTPILKYDASSYGGANMWRIEKQITSSTTYLGARFDFNYGDVAMFESDFSVKDDFKGTGF